RLPARQVLRLKVLDVDAVRVQAGAVEKLPVAEGVEVTDRGVTELGVLRIGDHDRLALVVGETADSHGHKDAHQGEVEDEARELGQGAAVRGDGPTPRAVTLGRWFSA